MASNSINSTFVYFELVFNRAKVGKVVIELNRDKSPKAVENFRCLCTGEKGIGQFGKSLSYKGSKIHKVITQCMVQGGDIIHGNGKGGESIYGEEFECIADGELIHDKPGIVGLVGNLTKLYSSQFYITTSPCPHLNGQNVIVGKVVKGLDLLLEMAALQKDDVPQEDIIISNCGQFEPHESWNIECNDGTVDIYPPGPNDFDCKVNYEYIKNIVEQIRNAGNFLFYQGNYIQAEEKYNKIFRYIIWFEERVKTRADISFNELKTTALLNLSAVRLKLNKNLEALHNCDEIIKKHPRNGKAYYRRACAKAALKDYDNAIRDLRVSYKLHPNDKNIKKLFERIKDRRQSYVKKEKVFINKFFNF